MKKIYTLITALILVFSNTFAQPNRNWGTYYGGPSTDNSYSTTVDGSGNVFIVGDTRSTTGVSTPGSHQSTYGGGVGDDAFIAKFNSSGILQWATYYGGAGDDVAVSVAADGIGNVYVVGQTNSVTAISTAGSHQPAFGGVNDAFLVKFNSLGVRQFATYYGAGGTDGGLSVSVDGSGNIYLSGITSSSTAISTVGSHQAVFGGGVDAFLVKFDSTGIRQYATYYGGTANEIGAQNAVDASGNIYLAGSTASSASISTVGSHQPVHGGGTYDDFLVKFNSTGVRQWATYYGGTGNENGPTVAFDTVGNVYIGGQTSSISGISSVGSHQSVFGGGTFDSYLTKFNNTGVRQWGTYYGGTGSEDGYAVGVDLSGNIYLSGETGSSTAISTVGSHQPVFGGGATDAYLTQFNSAGVRQWATYYGGTFNEYARCLAVNGSGKVYITGETYSLSAISTLGSYQPTFGGGAYDGYLVEFATCTVPTTPGTVSGTASICSGTTNTYSITAVAGATSFTWALPSGWSGTSTTNSINATASATSGNITVTANNACGNSSPQTLAITVNTIPATPGTISGTTTICSGTTNTYSITAISGATSYTWTLPSGWSGTSTTNSINATASATSGNITVTANNTCGNSSAATLAIVVNTIPATPGTISGTATICSGTTNTYSITAVAGATSYTWTLPGGWTGTSTTNSINATASATSGNITVTANNTCGNSTAATLAIVVNTIPATPGTISGLASMCIGTVPQTYNITAVGGATSYTWVLPATWSGTSTTNSIVTTPGTSGGNITVTANNGCGASSVQSLVVIVNPLPSVGLTLTVDTLCIDDTPLTLSGGSPSGGTFSGTGVSGGNFDPNAAGVSTHLITYSFTDGNSCTNTATDTIVVDLCLALPDVASTQEEIIVYPNPTTSVVTISGVGGTATIEVYNVLGKIVLSQQITKDNTEINLSKETNGIYFMTIVTKNNSTTKKIIKQ